MSSKNKVEIIDFDSQKPTHRLLFNLYEEINRISSIRLGRILTVVDASLADDRQRKAIKDLIQEAFWRNDLFADIRRMLLEFDQEFVNEKLTEKEASEVLNNSYENTPFMDINSYRSYFGKK